MARRQRFSCRVSSPTVLALRKRGKSTKGAISACKTRRNQGKKALKKPKKGRRRRRKR